MATGAERHNVTEENVVEGDKKKESRELQPLCWTVIVTRVRVAL